jgi:antitoxin HicB
MSGGPASPVFPGDGAAAPAGPTEGGMNNMLSYPVRLSLSENGQVTAFLPDLPEVTATCASEATAIRKLRPLLRAAVGDLLLRDLPLPTPSDICGAPRIGIRKVSLQPSGETR